MKLIHFNKIIMSVAGPIFMFVGISCLQIRFGHEVPLFSLYLIPIARLSWEFGIKGAAISVLTAVIIWLWTSYYLGQPFTSEWLRYYTAIMRVLVFAVVAILIVYFRRTIEQHRKRMEAMRSLLVVCHGCGSLQTSEGKWIPLNELRPTTSKAIDPECPNCRSSHNGLGE